MRNLLCLFFFIPSLCLAQEPYSYAGSASTAIITIPDTLKGKFMLSIHGGISVPVFGYGFPSAGNSNTQSSGTYTTVCGYAKGGEHLNVTGVFLTSANIGLAGNFGVDINPASAGYSQSGTPPKNTVNEYMAGLYWSIKPSQLKGTIYFLLLIGDVTANIPNENNTFSADISIGTGPNYQGGSGTEQPGFGTGVGCYFETGVLLKIFKDFYFNPSADILYAGVYFQNGTITTNYYSSSSNTNLTSVTNSFMEMNLGIIQVNLGISYHF